MISISNFFKKCLLFILACSILVVGNSSRAQDTLVLKKQLAFTKVDTARVKILIELSNIIETVNPNGALKYAEEAFKIAKKANYNKGIASALINIGSLQMYLGENDKALKTNQSLYQLCKQMGDETGMVSSLNNIASVYQSKSKSAKAAEYAFKALRTAEKIKDKSLIAICLSNIGTLFIQQQDFEKAELYAKKAQIIYRKLKEPASEAKNLETLGNCYAFNGNTERAKPYYAAALSLYEKLGNEMGKAIMYTQMVDCYASQPVKQIEYLQKAKLIWDKTAPNHLNAIANIGNYGYTLFQIVQDPNKLETVQKQLGLKKAEMLKDAVEYFERCINLSRQAGQNELVSMFTIEYAKLCEYVGNYKGALNNIKSHYQVQDSLYSQESKNKIATLEAQFAFQKKEDQYKQERELAKVRAQQTYLFAGLAIVLISSILLYLLNRSNINRLKLKNELLKKDAEEKTRVLLHQNRLFESELKAIRSQMNPHFSFNVLNSIEAYIMENDKKTASRLIQKFASLSRLILENSTKSLVSGDREWKALMLYTELEAMRYNNSFTYQFIVEENLQLKTLLLPPMLIQPLIENAILHGLIVNQKPDARLEVQIKNIDNGVFITVEDNGTGIDSHPKINTKIGVKEKSIGLSSIRERIELINTQGNSCLATFSIGSKTDGYGTSATIFLPYFDKTVGIN